jgi:hypothetical protein
MPRILDSSLYACALGCLQRVSQDTPAAVPAAAAQALDTAAGELFTLIQANGAAESPEDRALIVSGTLTVCYHAHMGL